jgi:hypothetical protein
MTEPQGTEPRYKAFLSYSHEDAALAARIHRRLETYRLPKRLVGSVTSFGAVPSRLWPIFRDREEMAASSDLSETVRSALAESAALIVLCSPAAAASRWVAEEIETFRALHPGRPVLAAIGGGNPPDCFPAPLRARNSDGKWHEPLATDLRSDADGPQLGLLKLVAGLTGVGLDDLVQRDAHRRIRRVTAVTGVALAAAIVMAALMVVAIGARREADRQRAEAEGLIEFMLTDLRDRLAGVGRLDALTAVNERALAYYEGRQNLSSLPDDSLARRARILQAIGEDNLHRHDLGAALLAFQEAYQTTGVQLARSPDDPRRILEHSKSEVGIGQVYEVRQDWPRARQHYRAFANAAYRLVAIEPDDPEYLMKAASGAMDLGTIELNGTRNHEAAERSYARAVALLERARRLRPDDHHVLLSLANAYGWLADSFFVREMWRDSLRARLRQNAVAAGLHERDPSNADFAFRLAAAQRGLAHTHLRMGGGREGAALLREALGTMQRLARLDRENGEWRMLLGMLSDDLEERRAAAARNRLR